MALQGDGSPSGNRDYETPWIVVGALGERFSTLTEDDDDWYFDLDPCAASAAVAKAPVHFTPRQDGLRQGWFGRVWLNPPYGPREGKCAAGCKKKRCERRGYHLKAPLPGIIDWVEKADAEWRAGNVERVVALLPGNACEQDWFQDIVLGSCETIAFLARRVHFELDGVPQKSPGINNLVAVWVSRRRAKTCPCIGLDVDSIEQRVAVPPAWADRSNSESASAEVIELGVAKS